MSKSISVFFPAYNDEASIEKMVLRALSVLRDITDDYEIIVVNDGSKDNTGKVLDRLAKNYKRIRVIHHKKNKGYGGALRTGFRNARKDLIFYTDGDGQYDVRELKKLLPFIKSADVVNGYKIKRADSLYRVVLGNLYCWVVRIFFNLRMKDVDCDFRLFRRYVFDKVNLESDSGVICVEMMKKVKDAGFKVLEVPIHHYPRLSGSSQFFKPRRIIRTLAGLLIQWYKLIFVKNLKKIFEK